MAENTLLQELHTEQKKCSEFIVEAEGRFTKLENLMEAVWLKLVSLEKRTESSTSGVKIDSPLIQQSPYFSPHFEGPDAQRLGGLKQDLRRDVAVQKPGSVLLKQNLRQDALIQKTSSDLQSMKLEKLFGDLSRLSDEPPSSKTSSSTQNRTVMGMGEITSMSIIHGQSYISLHSAPFLCFFLATSTGEPPTTQTLYGKNSQIQNELAPLDYSIEDDSRTKHLTSFLVVVNSNCSKTTRSVYLFVNFWEDLLLRVLDRLNFILVYEPGDVRSKEELQLVETIYPIFAIFYEVPNIVPLLSLMALHFLPLFGVVFQPLHPNLKKHISFIDCFDKYTYFSWTSYAINSNWWELVRYKLQWMLASCCGMNTFSLQHIIILWPYKWKGALRKLKNFATNLPEIIRWATEAASFLALSYFIAYLETLGWSIPFIAYLETLGWSIPFIIPLCFQIQCLPSAVSNAWLYSYLPPCPHYSFEVPRNYMSWVVQDCIAYINWVTPHIIRIRGFTTVSVLAQLHYYFIWVGSSYHGPISLIGSCWAFSTVAAVERVSNLVTVDLISLSEQALVDYATKFNEECNGELMDYAFQFIINNGGIDTEKDCSYCAVDGQYDQCGKNAKVVTIDGYEDIPTNDGKAVKKVVTNQPVSIAIEARGREFQLYVFGAFTGRCGTTLDHEFHLYVSGVSTRRCGTKLDHGGTAGILIGWSFCLVFEGNRELEFVLHHYLLFFIDMLQHYGFAIGDWCSVGANFHRYWLLLCSVVVPETILMFPIYASMVSSCIFKPSCNCLGHSTWQVLVWAIVHGWPLGILYASSKLACILVLAYKEYLDCFIATFPNCDLEDKVNFPGGSNVMDQ